MLYAFLNFATPSQPLNLDSVSNRTRKGFAIFPAGAELYVEDVPEIITTSTRRHKFNLVQEIEKKVHGKGGIFLLSMSFFPLSKWNFTMEKQNIRSHESNNQSQTQCWCNIMQCCTHCLNSTNGSWRGPEVRKNMQCCAPQKHTRSVFLWQRLPLTLK